MSAPRVTPLQIRAIHTIKTRAGLDEPSYRQLLSDFGVTSSKHLSREGADELLERMRLLPGATFASGAARGAAGPYAPKLQALWIAGWNLGIVRNRTDAAMHAFVQRQTGLDHTRFLRDHKAAASAIEALKAWLARDAGVDWPKAGSGRPDRDVVALKRAVLEAQWVRLLKLRIVFEMGDQLDQLLNGNDISPEDLDAASLKLGRQLRAATAAGVRRAQAA